MINTTVRMAQQRLLALGFDLGKTGIDGDKGRFTTAAIKAFQERTGLPATGTLTGETMAALLKSEAPSATAPNPNLRPPPDQLNASPMSAGAPMPMPNMRPPADVLGSGNADFKPRLRGAIPARPSEGPVQAPMLYGQSDPPRVGFGRSGPQGGGARGPDPQVLDYARALNPGASAAPGIDIPTLVRLGLTQGTRTAEGRNRWQADPSQGGMGQSGFPPQNMMPGPSSGGALGNDLPMNPGPPDQPTPTPPTAPMLYPPMVAGNDKPPFKPTPDNPGFGLPGMPANPTFMGAVGDAAGAGMSNIQRLLQGITGQPAQGQTAPPAQGPNFSFGSQPTGGSPELQDSLNHAAARKALEMQLWQMLLGARIEPQPGQPAVSDQFATPPSPGPTFTSPMGTYR